jgi:cytochrome c biogenesis protein CcmG, thiol:disulfide interchange protein DsbE
MIEPPHDKPSRAKVKFAALGIAGLILMVLGAVSLVYLVTPKDDPLSPKNDWVSAMPDIVDSPAPKLNLTDLDGNPVSLSDTVGQVVLVNNWAFWCPPCRAELPELQAYYDAHRQQGFTVIGIEAGDAKVDVAYHVKLFKLTYPIWLDLKQESLMAVQRFNLPNSYVVDKKGRMRLSWFGVTDRATLEKYVTPLLEE